MEKKILQELKKQLPRVKTGVLLKDHTTFNIGGPAEYFYIAKSRQDIVSAVNAAKKLKIPLFMFGGGSNLLVADKGLKGLVVKIQNKNIAIKKNTIIADAGVDMKNIVDVSIKASLEGLEWAGGLPGTFGGAIRGNAGAFGGEIKDSVSCAEAFDGHFTLRNFTNKQCKFSYRNSIFKEKSWTIVSATVTLKRGIKKELRAIADSHIAYRNEKHPLEYPSAGSIFKNINVKGIPAEFLPLFKDKIKQDPFPIVPAAWFIIGAGLTGKTIGRAQISRKHSNYIINLGRDAKEAGSAGSSVRGAKAKDVLALIAFAKKEVKEKYHIDMEPEVQFVGD